MIDEFGDVDTEHELGAIKFINIPVGRMHSVAFDFIFHAKYDRDTDMLRLFRKVPS